MKFRIRRAEYGDYTHFDYIVEEKGWLFWTRIGSTNDPEDFEDIVRRHLEELREEAIKDRFEPLYADAYWYRERRDRPSQIKFERTQA